MLATIVAMFALPARSETLPIDPVAQESPVWCWIAVTEMLMKHYDVPNANGGGDYQCGIVGTIAFGTRAQMCVSNCALCQVPAGSAQTLVEAIEAYPKRVRALLGLNADDVSATHRARALTEDEVVEEIDDGNPMIAGISPSGGSPGVSQHVALIVGYDDDGATLIVNDPFPFDPSHNPYLAAGANELEPGQYEISRTTYKSALRWRETILVKSSAPGEDTQSPPHFCCTAAGRLGPYPNDGSTLSGGACFGTNAFGIAFQGTACL
ncbi:C39 family peptidase [Mesorhizobium neociceri]|uniref:C39 family peptidase n=1 Tax=Mesorhizobium neociceri TaxID=1307853 RepID=A0A838B8I2_9HYPH|nr:C39 family peptidase [Mesorhizobium neociceri]MBA1142745.1 C39 family peptidase [Mesorhizobium neociceri]